MADLLTFDDIRDVVDEIAKENGVNKYSLTIKEEQFTGENYTSKIVRTKIVDDENKVDEMNLIIKLTTMSVEFRKKLPVDFIYETEVQAYTKLFPAYDKFQDEHNVPIEKRFVHPKFIRGGFEVCKEFMILEDLSYKGYQMYGRRNDLDFKHAKVILEQLARYHSISLAMKEKDPETLEKITKMLDLKLDFYDSIRESITAFLLQCVAPVPDGPKKTILTDFVLKHGDAVEKCLATEFAHPYNVLIHGDFHINNMLFKYEGDKTDVIFLDWQVTRSSSPACDLVRILYMTTNKQFRDKYFSQLCDIYYKTLEESLELYKCDITRVYPRDIFEKHLIDLKPFAIVNGITGSVVFLTKPGEEATLEEMFDATSKRKTTASDQLLERMDGFCRDIEEYESLNR